MTVGWVLILTCGGLCLVMPLTALATWVGDWTAARNRAAPPELSICVGCGVHLNSRDESRAHFEGPSCLTM